METDPKPVVDPLAENPPGPEHTDDIPHVESPYEGKKLSVGQQIAISAYWFATNFLWGALLLVMLPDEARKMAPFHRATALGFLTGLSSIVALVVPLIVGALSDRCYSRLGRRRPYMIVGVATNLIGLGLMALAFSSRHPIANTGDIGYWKTLSVLLASGSFSLFLLAYIVVQLGNNIASAAYQGLIPDLVPEKQRGAASGYMALMSQLGTLAGAVVCGMLISTGDNPLAAEVTHVEVLRYVAICLALAGVALITILGIKEGKLPVRPPKIEWGKYVKSLWIDPRVYPDFAWVWITRALVMLGFYSVLPFVNYYFIDIIGVAPEKASFRATIFSAVVLVTSSISGIYGGYLSDKIGRKRVVYIANSAIAVMSLMFIFCHTETSAMAVGALFGLGFGAYTSVDWALGTDVLPSKRNAGKEMAVWHVAMTLPQALAAPLASGLIESFGKTVVVVKGMDDPLTRYTPTGYTAMFIMVSICFALGAFFLRNVRGVK